MVGNLVTSYFLESWTFYILLLHYTFRVSEFAQVPVT